MKGTPVSYQGFDYGVKIHISWQVFPAMAGDRQAAMQSEAKFETSC